MAGIEDRGRNEVTSPTSQGDTVTRGSRSCLQKLEGQTQNPSQVRSWRRGRNANPAWGKGGDDADRRFIRKNKNTKDSWSYSGEEEQKENDQG